MSNYKEIVTKAVIGKGKKSFTTTKEQVIENKPSTILGCWVINHNFSGKRVSDEIVINGSYDVNIWYSYDNDTKTDVFKTTDSYEEKVKIRKREESDEENEEIIIRSLKQPSCYKVDIDDNKVIYNIEKELGIELVGDTKVKIETSDLEEQWDEIVEDSKKEEETYNNIDNEVKEEFIKEDVI